ncbi:LuxR C-terminal-related transcriptional regulator [Chloroflexota bacterium]
MKNPEQTEQSNQLLGTLATRIARNRSNVAKWDLNILIVLFAVLVTVIILISMNIDTWIVAVVAIGGLSLIWLIGWRRSRRLFQHFYSEELVDLQRDSADEPPSGMERLTTREKEILTFVARGYSNKMIAIELSISINTIKVFISRILTKLEASDRTEAVVIAIKQKILSIE